MSLKSSPTRYGTVAIAIHWVTAVAIIGMLISGLVAENSTDAAAELGILRVHAIMGALVGVLTILRIVWWVFIDRRPADATSLSRAQALAAHIVHYALYGAILVLVSSGFATVILSGANLQLFGAAPLPLPDFALVPPFTVHDIVSKLLIALLIGHIGAALWHQFIKRDRLMARMGAGR